MVRVALPQFVGVDKAKVVTFEFNVNIAGLGRVRDSKVDEQVVLVLDALNTCHANARVLNRRRQIPNIVTVDQELQFLMLEALPPKRRLHPIQRCGLSRTRRK